MPIIEVLQIKLASFCIFINMSGLGEIGFVFYYAILSDHKSDISVVPINGPLFGDLFYSVQAVMV